MFGMTTPSVSGSRGRGRGGDLAALRGRVAPQREAEALLEARQDVVHHARLEENEAPLDGRNGVRRERVREDPQLAAVALFPVRGEIEECSQQKRLPRAIVLPVP